MKQVFLFAALFASIIASANPGPSAVNEKVLKAFNQTFAAAKNVTWHEYQDYFQANFKQNDAQVRAQYDGEGRLIRTIRYYGESQLLPSIVAKLKKKYSGKEITGVTETSSEDEVSFTINLKDEENWYVVKSDVFGNLEAKEKFRRADQ